MEKIQKNFKQCDICKFDEASCLCVNVLIIIVIHVIN